MTEFLGQVTGKIICETGEFTVYRPLVEEGEEPVLVKVPSARRPAPEVIRHLEYEYKTAQGLNPSLIVRPLRLEQDAERIALVLEDDGAQSDVADLLGAPMEVGLFLKIALGTTVALIEIHQHDLIHKDLKPQNLLFNPETGQVRITGFGIASRLPRERQVPESPEVIAGTLAYMAPEQTGRMNRSIDSRSDLYSLGVTFYELLTGGLPFAAADPMEWVHCHIARSPPPPSERVASVPEPLSAIIMKLLSKPAEERYQTATGLKADLLLCVAQWESHGRIDPFPLGARDTSDRLLIPEKLYGRESEIDTMIAAFDRVVASGTPELVLVSGYSGIGKSSVVNELHKVLVPPRGLFAAGKFDQYKRDIPYSTLVQAFQTLICQILSKSEAEVASWREALREALSPNGQLLVDLIPEIELVIGKQPPIADLPPKDAQNRFQIVLRRFLSVFARPEHPLALFLDDLQWLDAATLELMESLVTQSEVRHLMLVGAYPEVRHLLLLGAYRDNEVSSSHPLMQTLENIRHSKARMQEIVLRPLALADVGRLVADSLNCERKRILPLARLVYEKTGGNPFFAIQFFNALAEEGLLAFDHGAAAWHWNLAQIRSKGFTDNIVDLMVEKLSRLPDMTQETLKQFACLGNAAEIATLSMVHEESEELTQATLWEAVRAGLVLCLNGVYTFLHDRMREAAYTLIAEDERAPAHLRIGRLLASRLTEEEVKERIFEIVGQFNRGAKLITAPREREQLAELNLIAGRRAKDSTAYAAALTYLVAGRALLPTDSWERQYPLTFALEFQRAQCEFITGELEPAQERLSLLSRQANGLPDLAAVVCLRVDLLETLDRSDRSVEVCLEYLRYVGIQWSPHPTTDEVREEYDRLWRQLGSHSIEQLVDLPLMSDPDCCATLNVLTSALVSALFTDDNLLDLIIARIANLSFENGNSDGSSLAYVWLGMILGPHFDNYQAAFRFGQLGLDLVEKQDLDRFKARVYLCFGACVSPWARPIRTGRTFIRRAFDTANRRGDLTFAVYSCANLNTNLLGSGDPLGEVQREAENGLEFARKIRFGLAGDLMIGHVRLIRTLRGLTPDFASFNDAEFDECRFEQHLEADPRLAIAGCWYWIRKLQARFYEEDYQSALVAALKVEPLLWTSLIHFESAEYHFYGALARAALYDSAAADKRLEHLSTITAHHKQLAMWAKNCPENFENRAALVAAEVARLERRDLEAMHLYQKAIRSARENGFVQNEAVANELAARFYTERGFETIGHGFFREARYCYVRWGADGKAKQLDKQYPWLVETKPLATTGATMATSTEQLDLMTVVKGQLAISGEILLDRLAETLLRIVLENAGAQNAYLFVEPDMALLAVVHPAQGTMAMEFNRAPPGSDPGVSASILNYVKRTRETVILGDASSDAGEFSADEYLQSGQSKSVLCMPIARQDKLIGVLYLENQLAAEVFTPDRRAVIEMLASQAAISLETAKLYSDLQQSQENMQSQTRILQSILDSIGDGVIVANEQGEFLLFNPAAEEILGIGAIETELKQWAKEYGMYLPDRCTLYPAEELPLAKALRGESVDKAEIFVRHPKCRQGVWLSVTARPLTDKTGVAHGGVAVFSDFTARKKAEEELGKLNAELEQKVDERTTQLRTALEKETLLRREIHHRVKNNLQVISSLLYLQSIHASDAGTREVLRECQSRTRSLALIHEKLYQSDKLTKIEFADYIRQLVASMFDSYRISPSAVRLKVNAEGVFLGLDAAIPCGLIITELVSNAFKYAFAGGKQGEIGIDFRLLEEGIFNLSVRDSGTGLPQGFHPEEAQTLGVKLVCDLTTQLKGTVEFKNENGTVVNITFPEPVGSEHE